MKKNKRNKKEFWHKQIFVISVPIYDVDVVVAINMSGEETAERIKKFTKKPQALEDAKRLGEEWDADLAEQSAHGKMGKLMGGFLVFVSLNKDRFRWSIGLLVHELTHVTHYLLRHRRIPLSEDTEEAHTHLIQYLTTTALRKMY